MSKQDNDFSRRRMLGMTVGSVLRRRVVAGIAAVIMGASLVFSGSASTQDQEFAGVWETVSNKYKFTLTLQQTGDTVTGTYTPNSGKIEGTVSGKILRFKWTSDGGKGSGRFVLDEGGMAFSGSYSNGDDPDKVDGTWNGTRKMGGGGGKAQAQDAPAATATKPEGYQKLLGEIRWKKIMGVPSADASGNTPLENICEPFYVVALTDDGGVVGDESGEHPRPIASATRLTRGRDREEYYRCMYEMFVPANKQLTVKAGMGDASQYWIRSSHYTTPWVGGQPLAPASSSRNVKLPTGNVIWVSGLPAESRVFDKPYKSVTVGRSTSLSFELGRGSDLSNRTRNFYSYDIEISVGWRGVRLDWCREWENNCGKPAADAFCQSKGFQEAKKFEQSANVPDETATIGDKRICDKSTRPSCDSFKLIECVRK